jgi:hypothetical protein
MIRDPKIGTRHTGTVKSARDFGAFIEILRASKVADIPSLTRGLTR